MDTYLRYLVGSIDIEDSLDMLGDGGSPSSAGLIVRHGVHLVAGRMGELNKDKLREGRWGRRAELVARNSQLATRENWRINCSRDQREMKLQTRHCVAKM